MPEEEVTEASAEFELEIIPAEKYERLLSAKAMNLDEAYAITASSRARIILLAGMPKSGKTTLIASLFHSFQRGPVAGYSFSGSRTLLGFDARCHDARVGSRRMMPTTERTKHGAQELFLHLQVQKNSDDDITDLLFVDISGEHYETIRDSVDECKNIPLLRRADHFVVLIDGERLADLTQRQRVRTDARMLIRSCLDSGELTSISLIDVLVSKWDMVQSSANKNDVTAFTLGIEDEIARLFSGRCAKLRFARVAARPSTADLPLGWGISDIFSKWVTDVPELFYAPKAVAIGDVCTEFDRLRLISTE